MSATEFIANKNPILLLSDLVALQALNSFSFSLADLLQTVSMLLPMI